MDVPAVAVLDDRRQGLFQERLRRGDLVYVGELEGEIVCATCFHPGPSPFDEEKTTFARWRLDEPSTFWSYDAMARPAVRSLGVVAKLFSVALAEVFGPRGGRRVRGFIHHWNQPSILLHLRMGFRVLGTLTAVGIPGLKWLRWECGGTTRQWVLPRRSDLALPP
jgi:hypothetical protein